MVLDKLNSENQILLGIIKNLSNERNIAQGKALISEQIKDLTEKQERINSQQLINKVKSVMGLIKLKDATMEDMMNPQSEDRKVVFQ